MKTIGVLVGLLLLSTVSAKENDAAAFPTEKFGMTDLSAHEVISKVSIVTLGGKGEGLFRQLLAASKTKERLAVDSSQDTPILMFGAPTQTKVTTSVGACKLRLEFLGVDGTQGPQVGDVVSSAHLVVLVVSGHEPKEEIDTAVTKLRKQMRPDRKSQLVVWSKGDGKSLLSTVVRTIQTGKLPAAE
jgi:hypothetical protein